MKYILLILVALIAACDGTYDAGEPMSSSSTKYRIDTVYSYRVDTVRRLDTTFMIGDTAKYSKTVLTVDTIKKVIDTTIYVSDTVATTTVRLDTLKLVKYDTTRSLITIVDTIMTKKFDTIRTVVVDTVTKGTTPSASQRIVFQDARDGRYYGGVKIRSLYWTTSPLSYNPNEIYKRRSDQAVLYPSNSGNLCPSGWRNPAALEVLDNLSRDKGFLDSINAHIWIDTSNTTAFTPSALAISNGFGSVIMDDNGAVVYQVAALWWGVVISKNSLEASGFTPTDAKTRWCVKDIVIN